MKLPLTFTLLLPILIVCSILIKGDATAVFVFIAIATISFFIEVRLRSGRLSKETIVAFFNTPIKKEDEFGNEVVDNSPKFSLLTGTLIILGAGILVFVGLAFMISGTESIAQPKDGDAQVISQLKDNGSDVSKTHNISLYLYFPTEENATKAATEIKSLYPNAQFDVHKLPSYAEWTLLVKMSVVPDLVSMHKIRSEFTQIASKYSGDYDGWEAEITR